MPTGLSLLHTALALCIVLQIISILPIHGSSYAGSYSYRSSRPTLSNLVRSKLSSAVKDSAMTRGIFYSRYSYRLSYRSSNPPMLCFNVLDSIAPELNTSILQPWYYRNATVLGVFACPLDDNQQNVYCCGDQLAERCCTFWDNPGRIAGVVVGIVSSIVVIASIAFVIRKRVRDGQTGSEVADEHPGVNTTEVTDEHPAVNTPHVADEKC